MHHRASVGCHRIMGKKHIFEISSAEAIGFYITADLGKRRGLNPDRESSHPGQASGKLHPVWHRWKTQDTGTRREEVASVVIGMETDEVAIQDPKQDLTTDGKDPDKL